MVHFESVQFCWHDVLLSMWLTAVVYVVEALLLSYCSLVLLLLDIGMNFVYHLPLVLIPLRLMLLFETRSGPFRLE